MRGDNGDMSAEQIAILLSFIDPMFWANFQDKR